MAQVKRETASICQVNDLLQGSFIRTEGWNPSYVSTVRGNISRANIIGVIVSKEAAGSIILDDSSGRIVLRSFGEDPFSHLDIGDLVMVIGRPRLYNEQKYVLPEIIKKIDPRWASFRRMQLEAVRKKYMPVKQEARIVVEDEPVVNYFQKMLEFIRDLDDGSGADMDEVIKRSQAPNAEELIRKLIEEGEIFELKPGKLKVLE